MANHEDISWGSTSTHGVSNKDLRLVRTSPHIDRWASDGSGSLIITPREDSATYSRSTTHFTLNSIVQDHASGVFSNGKYAVIGSLEDAAPSNTISGIGTVDTWMHPKDGRITLPNATLFAPEGEKLPERFDGLNVVRYAPDADQAKNYSNLTSTIESELSRNNIPTFLADSYGWHGVGMPPKEEVENLSRLVGSDKKLPTIHFGSPDSTMEGYLSNILKLKKYTEEDSFSPGSQSPMQQIDELEWHGRQYFDNVHPDTVEKYKKKETEYLERTRAEVEKWKDKHFPPEPVNILPEGFPQPLGNSTSIPPPLPNDSHIPLIPSTMIPGMPPIPGASVPPPLPNSMPVDTPLNMLGKSSEFHPKVSVLKNKYTSEINELYTEGLFTDISNSSDIATRLWGGESLGDIRNDYESKLPKPSTEKVTQSSVSKPTYYPSKNKLPLLGRQGQTGGTSVRSPRKKSERNNVKSFFNNKSILKSFDTETTGLNSTNSDLSKRDRIWQVGLAVDGTSGVEEHTSPFFASDGKGGVKPSGKMSTPYVKDALKHSNGRFSQLAFKEGNFNEFISLYEKDKLVSLESSLKNTLGRIDPNDVVVLQNMNFENKMLKSSLEQGLISQDFYTSIADRMGTVDLNKDGSINTLFQRPASVQSLMRQADMTYHTEYLNNLSEDSFQKYRQTVNNAIAEYSSVINNEQRVGAVAVELQDLSKAFLANAANRGLIEKETATLGLNVDFLSRAILGKSETHTALQDSKDTIDLFKKMWVMNTELNEDKVLSLSTLDAVSKIKKQQPEEINKRFISTVRSVLNDFKDNSFTNIGDKYTWYNPETILREKTNEGLKTVKLNQISTTPKRREYNIGIALDNVISRYSKFENNIQGLDRKKYTNKLMDEFNLGVTYKDLHNRVDNDYFNYKADLSTSNTTSNIVTPESQKKLESSSTNFLDQKTSLFGKEMKMKTKASILGGIGATLAYMAGSTRPTPLPDNDSNVSQQFYDEQYLGTAFVDFNERNKHYMM